MTPGNFAFFLPLLERHGVRFVLAGGGDYDRLAGSIERVSLLGQEVPVVSLEKLIHLKRAAGRPRDLEAIAELEAIREERERLGL